MKTREQHAAYLEAFDVALDAVMLGDTERAVDVMTQHVDRERAVAIVSRMPGRMPQWSGNGIGRLDGGRDDDDVVDVIPPSLEVVDEIATSGIAAMRGESWQHMLARARDARARTAAAVERAERAIYLKLRSPGLWLELVNLHAACARTEMAIEEARGDDDYDAPPTEVVRRLHEKNARRYERIAQIEARGVKMAARDNYRPGGKMRAP